MGNASSRLNKITAVLLIFLGIYINIPFSILGAIFDYPAILRQPVAEVLLRFHEGGAALIATWYAFALCPVLLIVAAKLLRQVLKNESENLSAVAGTFGILAGIFQALGLIRWVFLVPSLADAYVDPNATAATRAAAETVFLGFHQYAGVAVGEHLGQLFTALWIALLSIAMFNSAIFRRWQGFIGLAISALMFLGLAEGFATVGKFDPGIFGIFTPVSFILLSIWMIVLGVMLLLQKNTASANDPSAV